MVECEFESARSVIAGTDELSVWQGLPATGCYPIWIDEAWEKSCGVPGVVVDAKAPAVSKKQIAAAKAKATVAVAKVAAATAVAKRQVDVVT